jgi:predicted nicotinamide N-methyase
VLAKYLEHHYPRDHWVGKRVLEVGAGCGLVGLALGLQGADAVLTDRAEVIPTLKENVQKNITALAHVRLHRPIASRTTSTATSTDLPHSHRPTH